MNYLDLVGRLIVLGGWAFVAVWVWSIVRTPNSSRCIECSRALAPVDMVLCSDCLGV